MNEAERPGSVSGIVNTLHDRPEGRTVMTPAAPRDATPNLTAFIGALLTGRDRDEVLASDPIRAIVQPDPARPAYCQFVLLDECTNPVETPAEGKRGPRFKYCTLQHHNAVNFSRHTDERLAAARTAADAAAVRDEDLQAARAASPAPAPQDGEDPLPAIDAAERRLSEQIVGLQVTATQLHELTAMAFSLRQLRAFIAGKNARVDELVAAANRRAADEQAAAARAEQAARAAAEEAERHAQDARAARAALQEATAAHQEEMSAVRQAAERQVEEAREDTERRIAAANTERDEAREQARLDAEAAEAEVARVKAEAREAIA